MPRWRWFRVQGLLFFGAGVLFGLSWLVGVRADWIGAAAVVSFAIAAVALSAAYRARRQMLEAQARQRRRRGGG